MMLRIEEKYPQKVKHICPTYGGNFMIFGGDGGIRTHVSVAR